VYLEEKKLKGGDGLSKQKKRRKGNKWSVAKKKREKSPVK